MPGLPCRRDTCTLPRVAAASPTSAGWALATRPPRGFPAHPSPAAPRHPCPPAYPNPLASFGRDEGPVQEDVGPFQLPPRPPGRDGSARCAPTPFLLPSPQRPPAARRAPLPAGHLLPAASLGQHIQDHLAAGGRRPGACPAGVAAGAGLRRRPAGHPSAPLPRPASSPHGLATASALFETSSTVDETLSQLGAKLVGRPEE